MKKSKDNKPESSDEKDKHNVEKLGEMTDKEKAEVIRNLKSALWRAFVILTGIAVILFCLVWKWSGNPVIQLIFGAIGGITVLIAIIDLILIAGVYRSRLYYDGQDEQIIINGENDTGSGLTDGGDLSDEYEQHDLGSCTYEDARERLHAYLTKLLKKKSCPVVQLLDSDSGIREQYKPLICYDILITLAEVDKPEQWSSLLDCGKALADKFSEYLSRAGEEALPGRIQYFIAVYASNREKTASDFGSFIKGIHGYLSEHFMAYVRAHAKEL